MARGSALDAITGARISSPEASTTPVARPLATEMRATWPPPPRRPPTPGRLASTVTTFDSGGRNTPAGLPT